jgi:putative acetyltransferase
MARAVLYTGPEDGPLQIRSEREDDIEAIRRVHREAFGRDEEADLVEALRTSEAYLPELSLVAEVGGEVAGHVLLTRLGLEGCPVPPLLALAPVAVRPEYQRKGIGSSLVTAALLQADAAPFAGVVVLGHAEYYPRFGFVPASRFGITCPLPVPDEVFMARERRPGSLAVLHGAVRYPPPFGIE